MPSREEHPELAPPLDFSFCCISSVEELLRAQPRVGPSSPRPTHALRLNNNSLGGLGGLPPTLEQLLVSPVQLCWLDLSFNRLTTIDPVLTTFRSLRSLQLHGNSIGTLAEVDKLGALPRLRRLTLHGNPMEEQRGYRYSGGAALTPPGAGGEPLKPRSPRSYVLFLLPHLTSLDFSGVTRQDREDVANARPQRGKKKGGTQEPRAPTLE